MPVYVYQGDVAVHDDDDDDDVVIVVLDNNNNNINDKLMKSIQLAKKKSRT